MIPTGLSLSSVLMTSKALGYIVTSYQPLFQSIHKQKPTRTAAVTVVGRSQVQFVKQIKFQTSQLRKWVARIQNDITHLSMLRSM
jgi:hypothetical protein